MHEDGAARATVAVQLPGATDATSLELGSIVAELLGSHPMVERVLHLPSSGVGSGSPRALRAALGNSFDEFYYSHDATGDICRRLARAYPLARKVCIGDGFGMVYPADFIRRYQRPLSIAQRLRFGIRDLLAGPELRPDAAVLILPVDPTGRGLQGIDLTCVTRDAFLGALEHCRRQVSTLHQHEAALLGATAGRRRYLLLTEPYAEAGHVDEEREGPMYIDIVRRHCEPGSAVIVKQHPLESGDRAAQLRAGLNGAYDVFGASRQFARYPIELWENILGAATVICAAYPVLSLKYAYGIDVIQPMDDTFIEQWFEPGFRQWTRDSLRLYTEPLRRLHSWDGSGLLWTDKTAT